MNRETRTDLPAKQRRKHPAWPLIRRLLWWAVIAGLAITAAWWLPHIQSPRLEPVAYSLAAEVALEDPVPSPSPEQPPPEIEGPESGSDFVFGKIIDWLAASLSDSLISMADAISQQTLNLPVESLQIMDPADPAGFNAISFGVSRAAMLLLITVGAIWVMTHETLQTTVSLKQLTPRIIIGFVAMEMSVRILSWVIAHTNAAVNAILAVGFGGISSDKIADTLRHVADEGSHGRSWMIVTLTVGLLVMVTLLLIGLVSRTLVLMLLAITGPFALACHALPATEIIAKTWWKALAACAASAIAQALVLVLWFRLFFDGENRVVNPLNMPESLAQYADMLLILALLWVMHKAISIPMKKAFASTGGSPLGPIGSLARGIIMAKTFGLAGGVTGGGRTASAASKAGATAPSGPSHRSTGLPPHGATGGGPPPGPDGGRPAPTGGGPAGPGPTAPRPGATGTAERRHTPSPAGHPVAPAGHPAGPRTGPEGPVKPGGSGQRRPFLPPLPAHLRPRNSRITLPPPGPRPVPPPPQPPPFPRKEPRQW